MRRAKNEKKEKTKQKKTKGRTKAEEKFFDRLLKKFILL